MNKELFKALDDLETEQGIPKQYMLEKIELALVAAAKKEYGPGTKIRVAVNEEKKDFKVYVQKEVVAVVDDPETQISLEDAKSVSRRYTIGKTFETEMKTTEVRRLSAGAARSVIVQAIHEKARMNAAEAYESKKEEIITTTVLMYNSETGDLKVKTDTGTLTLRKDDQIPGETYRTDQKLRVFIREVNHEARGPLVTISRTNAGFLHCLFKIEVPEIGDGTVSIKGIAREAGSRSKIAVMSNDESVDAVGACVGPKGARINAILDEIAGEKVDIIKYSEKIDEFIAAALAPATITSVEMTGERTAKVIVTPDQLSLAIGREGQNARLAARLTNCKIDIKTE